MKAPRMSLHLAERVQLSKPRPQQPPTALCSERTAVTWSWGLQGQQAGRRPRQHRLVVIPNQWRQQGRRCTTFCHNCGVQAISLLPPGRVWYPIQKAAHGVSTSPTERGGQLHQHSHTADCSAAAPRATPANEDSQTQEEAVFSPPAQKCAHCNSILAAGRCASKGAPSSDEKSWLHGGGGPFADALLGYFKLFGDPLSGTLCIGCEGYSGDGQGPKITKALSTPSGSPCHLQLLFYYVCNKATAISAASYLFFCTGCYLGKILFSMTQRNCNILCWNVRGLHDVVRQDTVSLLVRDTASTIVCLQETKMQNLDQGVVRRTVGAKFANTFVVLPATQTRGGILIAVNEDYFQLSDQHLSTHAVTATVTMRADGTKWQITVVYGLQGDAEKLQCLQKLAAIPCPAHGRWLVLGDFNFIYQAEDKNNSNLNHRLMASFKAVIDDLNLKEIGLNGRHFTWSNEQDNPTLTRIDRFFCTPDWELTLPTCFLHSLPSLMSDHTPLLLQGELEHCHNRTFRFENFWVKMDGFRDLVEQVWSKHVHLEQVWSKHVHSFLSIKRLHTKLARVAKGLKQWRRE
ncbi:unnamed protein product [Miscanthus lutarioriparius]|uniref:Endonuclease/exonuclease/phosphatase domain-containing protein n=1 Tax=Miscanthus lutarioriparius TaxID=422564 RepID=A0A811N312_9POAL|nr:unnamed protein product [Miscanthus lutarioriparius]